MEVSDSETSRQESKLVPKGGSPVRQAQGLRVILHSKLTQCDLNHRDAENTEKGIYGEILYPNLFTFEVSANSMPCLNFSLCDLCLSAVALAKADVSVVQLRFLD